MSTYSLPGASSEGDHGQRGRCPEGSLALQGLQGLREEDPGAYLQSMGGNQVSTMTVVWLYIIPCTSCLTKWDA